MRIFSIFVTSLAILALPAMGIAEQAEAPAATTQPSALPPGVLVKVNDAVLTQAMIDTQKKYQVIPEYVKLSEIVMRWIDVELKAQEARRIGLDRDPEVIQLVNEIQTRLLAHILIKQKQDAITITDEEMKAYYDENKDERMFHEENILSFDVIATKTKDEAKKIQEQLDAGTSWAQLVKTYEEQTCNITGLSSATIVDMRGEDIAKTVDSQFRRNLMIAARRDSKKPSKPLRFRRGKAWAVAQINKTQPGALKPLEDFKVILTQKLSMEKRKAMMKEFPKKLKANAVIIKSAEVLEAEKAPPASTGPDAGLTRPKPPKK